MQVTEAQDKCLNCLGRAIKELNGEATPSQLEQIAELISQTMTGPWRFFHTPEHIFEVGSTEEPVDVLAALFHDLVYVQVDNGISLNISSYITPFVKDVRGHIVIRESDELPKERGFNIVTSVFGFSPCQTLSPFAGQNEFLSAVIAAKCLENVLPERIIAEIAACIEATIPFRPKLESGLTAMDLLYQRMINISNQYNFGWTEEKAADVVKRAVRLANRDVKNFAYHNSADFLDNTWNLLPETNHELSNANSYTVNGYRKSLQKMEGFMNFLKPELVFQQFMGEPDDRTYQELISRTSKNLEVARLYLGSKLTAVAILEALSYRMGQDIPISTMMGELSSRKLNMVALENFIPDVTEGHQPRNALESEVLDLLSKGRNRESSYDLKHSPITTFIIKYMGFERVGDLLRKAKEFFKETQNAKTEEFFKENQNLKAEEFLKECDPEVIKMLTEAVEKLFDSRKVALRRVN